MPVWFDKFKVCLQDPFGFFMFILTDQDASRLFLIRFNFRDSIFLISKFPYFYFHFLSNIFQIFFQFVGRHLMFDFC